MAQPRPILQRSLPYDPGASRGLPGVAPLDPGAWLQVDDAYQAQMEERARLLAERRSDVLYMEEAARGAVAELYDLVIGALPDPFRHICGAIRRPDGVVVTPDPTAPLETLCRLVQEDLVVMMRRRHETQHHLRAAILCFPANWRLGDKVGRPLVQIHAPVPEYDTQIARRVQRLFDGVQPGRPLWRCNLLDYMDADLYQPQARKPTPAGRNQSPFLRSERQCVLRLPHSRAVVFSIHTYVLRRADLPDLRRIKD